MTPALQMGSRAQGTIVKVALGTAIIAEQNKFEMSTLNFQTPQWQNNVELT